MVAICRLKVNDHLLQTGNPARILRDKPCRRHFKRSADHKKKISFIKLFIKGFKMLNEIAEQHDIRFNTVPHTA